MPVGDLSGGEQARVRIAQLMLQPADLLLLDEPTNDLDIPALEVLEDSLAEFPGALVLVSHDRDLMDRLCTEVVGLDGRGGAALYGSVGQWLTAYERAAAEAAKRRSRPRPAPRRRAGGAEAAQAELPRAAGMGADGSRHPRRRGSGGRRGRPRWSGPPRPATSPWPRPAGRWKRPSTPSNGSTPAGRNWKRSAVRDQN